MAVAKLAISIHHELLVRLDRLVKKRVFPSRSSAIQKAVEEKLARIDRSRLARACALLNQKEETEMAEEGNEDLKEWPKY